MIGSEAKACGLVDMLEILPGERRVLFLDFEGINLCRDGKLCIGQLTIPAPKPSGERITRPRWPDGVGRGGECIHMKSMRPFLNFNPEL